MNFTWMKFIKKSKFDIKKAYLYSKAYVKIKELSLFNEEFYKKSYPQLAGVKMDLLVHYLFYGYAEGKNPSEKFDNNFYLKTYPDIKRLRMNPLVHYVLYGVYENRIFRPVPIIDINCLNKKTDIIIPICNDYEETKECIMSVLNNTNTNYTLFLVNDCSTDKRIYDLLMEISKLDNVRVIENKEKSGLVKTLNNAIKESTNDVVLLNNNTKVTKRWLQKLKIAAYSNKNIGTVTPISTEDAFPPSKLNIISSNLSLENISKLIERVSNHFYMSALRGNNFCIFIKRDTLNDVGDFEGKKDLFAKAKEKSWENIIDDSTYIHHKKQQSYSKKLNSNILKKIQENIHNPNSNSINLDKKRILYVLHYWSYGGTHLTSLDLMCGINDEYESYVLLSTKKNYMELKKYENGSLKHLSKFKFNKPYNFKDFHRDDFSEIYFKILIDYNIDLVHIRHLLGHTFDLPSISKKLNIPTVISFHDFYFICPTINLVNGDLKYCELHCENAKGQCIYPESYLKQAPILKDFKPTWNKEVNKLLTNCSVYVTTSNSAKKLYLETYEQLKIKDFRIIEHGRDFNIPQNKIFHEKPDENKPIKILCLGNMLIFKGRTFIRKLNELDSSNRLELHFQGHSDPLKDIGEHHGGYARDEYYKKIEQIKPSFIGIFSIWPETYSHTLSEAWACKIPVLSSQYGALMERTIKNNGGWVLDINNPQKAYDKIIEIAKNKEEYNKIEKQVNNIKIKTVKEMANDYLQIYKKLI